MKSTITWLVIVLMFLGSFLYAKESRTYSKEYIEDAVEYCYTLKEIAKIVITKKQNGVTQREVLKQINTKCKTIKAMIEYIYAQDASEYDDFDDPNFSENYYVSGEIFQVCIDAIPESEYKSNW